MILLRASFLRAKFFGAVLLLIASMPAFAVKHVTSQWKVVKNANGCVTFEWQTDTPGTTTVSKLQYYPDGGDAWDWITQGKVPISGSATRRVAWSCNMRGKTYVYLMSSAANGVDISDPYTCPTNCGDTDGDGLDAGDECTSSETGGKLADPAAEELKLFCEVGNPPYLKASVVNTDPALRPDPDPPVHALDPDTEPTIEETFTATGTNFNSQLAAAAAHKNANASEDVLLSVPCGATIQPEDDSSPRDNWTIPTMTPANANTLVIKPDCDAKRLFPVGVQYSPEAEPFLTKFAPNTRDHWALQGATGVRNLFISADGVASGGIRMDGVALVSPNHADLATVRTAILSYSGGAITVADTSIFRLSATGGTTSEGNLLWVYMPGVGNLQGLCSVSAFNSTQITCNGKSGTGTYSGGGEIVQVLSSPVTSCTGATPPVCTLGEDFAFHEAAAITISSIANGNQLVLASAPSNGNFGVNGTIKVRSSATQDGFYSITAINTGTNTLTLATSGLANCSSSCGNVRNARIAILRGNSNPLINKTWYVDATPGSEVVTLRHPEDENGGGVTGTGGYMVSRTPRLETFIRAGAPDFERFVFRGIIDYRFPFGATYTQLIANESANIDFWGHTQFWHAIDPLTKRNSGGFNGSSQGLYSAGALNDYQLSRATMIADGFCFFKDGGFHAQDLTLGPFTCFTPDRYIARINANSDGLSYGHQNKVEIKGLLRGDIFGQVRGSNPNRAPTGVSLEIFPGASALGYTTADDIHVHDSLFYETATGIEITYNHGGNAEERYLMPGRVKIDNILAITDYMKYQPQPSENCGFQSKCTAGGGYFLNLMAGGTVKLSRIFFAPRNSPNTGLLVGGMSVPSQGLSIDKVFAVSSNGNTGSCSTGGFCATASVKFASPSPPGSAGSGFLRLFEDTAGNGASVLNLVAVGGTTQSLFGDTDERIRDLADSVTVLKDELASRAGLSGLTYTAVGGSGSGDSVDSMGERLDSVFMPKTFVPIVGGLAAGKTIDVNGISDKQLRIRNPSLSRISNTLAQVSFIAPSATQDCKYQVADLGTTRPAVQDTPLFMDPGSDLADLTSWTAVSEGSASRSFTITVESGNYYDVRLSCGRTPIHKQFRAGS